MTDLERILTLWRELNTAGADYVLATVVAVEGSSYRKPGALMLLTADGRRAGTVSGGCLEAEVTSRAWWLTANGPTVQRYSTAEDDGDRPFGSGCGGAVFLLLERRATANSLLSALNEAFLKRVPFGAATVLEGSQIGQRAFAGLEWEAADTLAGLPHAENESLEDLAKRALMRHESIESNVSVGAATTRAWVEYRPARPALGVFGAGDDAQPLVRMAKELGWFVCVADGRSNLATWERFPLADAMHVLPIEDLPEASASEPSAAFRTLGQEDAAVVMTHSFEQDAKVLACLLAAESTPCYIGVLGPQRRTRELLGEAAKLLNLPEGASPVEHWLAQLHAPTGLDLGAESPETIALSVLAEIQKVRTASTALPLRKVRAAAATIAG
jgi:xanthine/CO dehydrogenase XdhC/CoxF family maturation factor